MSGAAATSALPDEDVVQRFMLESSGIRGDLVRLGTAVDRIVTRHAYPAPLAALLGEMLALTAMLSSMMKYEGIFTLQMKGDGPVKMMIADMTSEGHLRGYAGFDAARLAAVLARPRAAGRAARPGIGTLLGRGHLAFTVDQGPHTERYQGIVELTGQTLADCLQHYFRQSEQIHAGLMVAVDRVRGAWGSAGLILQRIPEQVATRDAEAAEEAWRRAMILQASCTTRELLDRTLPINDLLYRLFHEEGVRVYRRRPLVDRCRCSRARLEETLRAMPRAQVEDLKVDGEVVVTCQFCNKDYRFDGAALDRIYAS
ncbi:MAG: Hsp33 family molecular chaperone HslO [Kiloniellaceae bacterium]